MFNNNLLKNRRIIITGGATGLGFSMAETFGSLGASIIIISRNEENLKNAEKNLRDLNIDSYYYKCDIRDYESISKTLGDIENSIGIPDTLVNNAAGNFISKTDDISRNGFDAIVNIVLHGTFYFSQLFGKMIMKNNIRGTILNIVASYAWTGSPYLAASAAAKAGVLALTRSMAVEWGPKGIRTVAIAPGLFYSENTWRNFGISEDIEKIAVEKTPLKRLVTKSEVSNLAAYLISDMASFINGEVITIDGGAWLSGNIINDIFSGLGGDFFENLMKKSRK
ncbi:SDR family oxidoreductase [Picrophilus oshimae]|uniref:Dehydrogenase n=1 Tax=Picrophilus torridus (strain ATCC 700027 / DSM 9790 / JCM 10055 / NBRC 100828 / KAW 2/3) TaxID=1122961 RepID=Q6L1W9_PICTO|nr:SDR family oxidoreductase [Picrophilus oshimae]AAT43033.1 dehydrogenase [Picrophilus oshimae DSM 9789]